MMEKKKIDLDIETALTGASANQLWSELKCRFMDCILIYDAYNTKGDCLLTDIVVNGTLAQALGLVKFAEINLSKEVIKCDII